VLEALQRVKITSPIVLRLDGTNASEGRAILAPHLSGDLITEQHVGRRTPRGGTGEVRTTMSIFGDEHTKVIVQGLTVARAIHGLRNRDYGTQVVGGVTPAKAAPTWTA